MAEHLEGLVSQLTIRDTQDIQSSVGNVSADCSKVANESSEFEDMIPDRAASELTVVSDLETSEDAAVVRRPQNLLSGNQRDPKFRSSFAALDTSDDEPPQLGELGIPQSPQPPKQGLLPFSGGNRAKNWSSQSTRSNNGTYSAMGVRREQTKIENLESENFQLKLKITNMERDQRVLGGPQSQTELSKLREECAKHKARALEMESRVDKLMAQRRREYDEDVKELESELQQSRDTSARLQKELDAATEARQEFEQNISSLQDELTAVHEAKDELDSQYKDLKLASQKTEEVNSQLKAELEDLKLKLAEESKARVAAEAALKSKTEIEAEAVERLNELFVSLAQLSYDFVPNIQIASSTQGILELSKLVVDVFDYVDDVQATLDRAMDQLETLRIKASEQEKLLEAASTAFGSSASHHQLPMQVTSMLNENQALEDQLKQHEQHKVEIIENMEHSHQQALQEKEEAAAVANESLLSLQQKYSQLIDKVEEANHRSYNIVKIFFRRISAQMGAEYMDRINSELSAIVAKCEATGKSKLPLLTDLMAEYVDEFCKLAKSPNRILRECEELRGKVKSLETILTEELKHRGADSVLIARLRDLEIRFKDEQEKRRLEYDSYQRKLANMST